MEPFLIVVLAALLTVIFGGFTVTNEMERRKQTVCEARSNVAAVLARRAQTANRLVDIVHAYGQHEQITHLRVSENNASGTSLRSASQEFYAAMNRITTSIPNFPELKADRLFIDLMNQLQEVEQTLNSKREQLNAKVRDFNTYRNQTPNILFAYGFPEEEYFDDSPAGDTP